MPKGPRFQPWCKSTQPCCFWILRAKHTKKRDTNLTQKQMSIDIMGSVSPLQQELQRKPQNTTLLTASSACVHQSSLIIGQERHSI